MTSRRQSRRSRKCPSRKCPPSTSTKTLYRRLRTPHPSQRRPSLPAARPARRPLAARPRHTGLVLRRRAATAWAEWYRALAGTGLPPAHAVPRDLWRWPVDLDRVALLDDDDRLRRVGLPPPLPTIGQWPACQFIGDQLHRDGYKPSWSPPRPARNTATLSFSVTRVRSPAACRRRRRRRSPMSRPCQAECVPDPARGCRRVSR